MNFSVPLLFYIPHEEEQEEETQNRPKTPPDRPRQAQEPIYNGGRWCHAAWHLQLPRAAQEPPRSAKALPQMSQESPEPPGARVSSAPGARPGGSSQMGVRRLNHLRTAHLRTPIYEISQMEGSWQATLLMMSILSRNSACGEHP